MADVHGNADVIDTNSSAYKKPKVSDSERIVEDTETGSTYQQQQNLRKYAHLLLTLRGHIEYSETSSDIRGHLAVDGIQSLKSEGEKISSSLIISANSPASEERDNGSRTELKEHTKRSRKRSSFDLASSSKKSKRTNEKAISATVTERESPWKKGGKHSPGKIHHAEVAKPKTPLSPSLACEEPIFKKASNTQPKITSSSAFHKVLKGIETSKHHSLMNPTTSKLNTSAFPSAFSTASTSFKITTKKNGYTSVSSNKSPDVFKGSKRSSLSRYTSSTPKRSPKSEPIPDLKYNNTSEAKDKIEEDSITSHIEPKVKMSSKMDNLVTPASTVSSISKGGGCNCKRSQCLKLYCTCFAVGRMCTAQCNCQSCHNTVSNVAERDRAIQSLLDRNPEAFQSKFTLKSTGLKDSERLKKQSSQSVTDISSNATAFALRKQHKFGCKCKMSFCRKGYCECYQSGVSCSDNCICVNCKNRGADSSIKTPSISKTLASAASMRIFSAAAAVAAAAVSPPSNSAGQETSKSISDPSTSS